MSVLKKHRNFVVSAVSMLHQPGCDCNAVCILLGDGLKHLDTRGAFVSKSAIIDSFTSRLPAPAFAHT